MTPEDSMKKDGGPAFARAASEVNIEQSGMSLRDWFAGQAMQGLCADPSSHELFDSHKEAAETAYQIADAMLEARK